MFGLLGNCHVLVNNADTALLSQRNCQTRFGHGIHRRRYQRYVQGNVSRKLRLERNISREYSRVGRHEQHVIEGQAFLENPHHKNLSELIILAIIGKGQLRVNSIIAKDTI